MPLQAEPALQAEPVEYFDRFFAAMGNRQALWPFLVAETNKYFQWHHKALSHYCVSYKRMSAYEKYHSYAGIR